MKAWNVDYQFAVLAANTLPLDSLVTLQGVLWDAEQNRVLVNGTEVRILKGNLKYIFHPATAPNFEYMDWLELVDLLPLDDHTALAFTDGSKTVDACAAAWTYSLPNGHKYSGGLRLHQSTPIYLAEYYAVHQVLTTLSELDYNVVIVTDSMSVINTTRNLLSTKEAALSLWYLGHCSKLKVDNNWLHLVDSGVALDFLSGRSLLFNYESSKISKSKRVATTPFCECSEVPQERDHLMFECPNTLDLRQQLKGKIPAGKELWSLKEPAPVVQGFALSIVNRIKEIRSQRLESINRLDSQP